MKFIIHLWEAKALVVVATIAIAMDVKPVGNTAITTLIEASGIASVSGWLSEGSALGLSSSSDHGGKAAVK